MIFDQLARAEHFRSLGSRFAAGFDYLQRTNLAEIEDGRYAIVGKDVFAIVQTYTTKPPEQGRWEAHRHHADIQHVIRGRERMGIAALALMRLLPPYDAEVDVEFYDGQGQFFEVPAGSFALFLPHDVHMPSLHVDGAEIVKKVVIKVRL